MTLSESAMQWIQVLLYYLFIIALFKVGVQT